MALLCKFLYAGFIIYAIFYGEKNLYNAAFYRLYILVNQV
jgi:hypothetical protein